MKVFNGSSNVKIQCSNSVRLIGGPVDVASNEWKKITWPLTSGPSLTYEAANGKDFRVTIDIVDPKQNPTLHDSPIVLAIKKELINHGQPGVYSFNTGSVGLGSGLGTSSSLCLLTSALIDLQYRRRSSISLLIENAASFERSIIPHSGYGDFLGEIYYGPAVIGESKNLKWCSPISCDSLSRSAIVGNATFINISRLNASHESDESTTPHHYDNSANIDRFVKAASRPSFLPTAVECIRHDSYHKLPALPQSHKRDLLLSLQNDDPNLAVKLCGKTSSKMIMLLGGRSSVNNAINIICGQLEGVVDHTLKLLGGRRPLYATRRL